MRVRLALVIVALLGALWCLHETERRVSPDAGTSAANGAQPQAATASAAIPAVERQAVAAVDDGAFVSEAEADGVVAGAVRDGMVVLVLDAARAPLAGASLDVRWRKGFGKYGNDRGRTDARGRFATTIAEFEMIEGITLHDAEHGDLANSSEFLPMADDARTVLVVVPTFESVVVRVVDTAGAAIAGATVACECGSRAVAPREHRLVPKAIEGTTAGDGAVTLRLPVGTHELEAKCSGFDTLYTLHAEVPAGGRSLRMHLLDRRGWHDVEVTVKVPDTCSSQVQVQGWTSELPPGLPIDAATGCEPVQLQFQARRVSLHAFVVHAPPLPWHCSARSEGFSGRSDVGAFDASAVVELRGLPVAPKARLRCKLLLPGGEQVSGEVMVHQKADLVYGPRLAVSVRDPVVEVEPGGTACVSAWVYQHAPCIIGPIELEVGEQELVFQFVRPQSIRGRVVDERGEAMKATVELRRPAGALRALAADVPTVLETSASGDSRGTGDDGRFEFVHLGEGEHELWVRPAAVAWPARVRVQPGDQDIVVRLGAGLDDRVRIQGRVTLAGTGEPLVGTQVRCGSQHWSDSCYTDAGGRYVVVMPPGKMKTLVLARRCAVLRTKERTFAAGLHTEDFVLTPSEPLFVRVRDADGKVPAVEIAVLDDDGEELPLLDAYGNHDSDLAGLDDSGRAELRGVPTTAFRLRLQSDDEDAAKVQTMVVPVPAGTRRDVDFPIVWQPARK